MTKAIDDVIAERQRQMAIEGWTTERDDREHRNGELSLAGAAYALAGQSKVAAKMARDYKTDEVVAPHSAQCVWPWHKDWWKPTDQRRNLVKAAALLIADIERLDRKAARKDK